MIRFALVCDNGHEHEAWFSGSGEYDRLHKAGHLQCPVCGSGDIGKMLMAPAVNTSRRKATAPPEGPVKADSSPTQGPSAPNPQPSKTPAAGQNLTSPTSMAAIPDEVRTQVTEKLRELKKAVIENSEDVGDRFSEEARKIHYGEAENRGIYGKATPKEAVDLWEEGVEAYPMPNLPEEKN